MSWSDWPILVTIALAATNAATVKVAPRRIVCSLLLLWISLALTLFLVRVPLAQVMPVHRIAGLAAGLCLFWSIAPALFVARPRPGAEVGAGSAELVSLAHAASLMTGATAAAIELVVLAFRGREVVVALISGAPAAAQRSAHFGLDGIVVLLALLASAVAALWINRNTKLVTAIFWIALATTLWACLLTPTYHSTQRGVYERTGQTLLVLIGVTVVLGGGVAVGERRQRIAAGFEHLGNSEPVGDAECPATRSGFRASCGAVGVGSILLVCYHYAVPVDLHPGGFRLTAAVCAICSTGCAASMFRLARRHWSASLSDVGMALATLGLCGLALAFVPARPVLLAERFPLVFNALIVGLAVATVLWVKLSGDWAMMTPTGSWPVRQLAGRAGRFAFLSAGLGLTVSMVLAIWPRLPAIAADDDSLGRFASGVAANLFLLLAVLWSARRLKRVALHVLAVLVLLAMMAFVGARMLPFTTLG